MAIRWVSELFSTSASRVVKNIGKIIDDVHTSKEEKLTAITARLVTLDRAAKKHELSLEKELTRRLAVDTKSDSWLSKNVRPMALIFLTIAVTVLAYATTLNPNLTADQLDSLQVWVPFYTILMSLAYGFYFGSRGYEKVTEIKERKKKDEI